MPDRFVTNVNKDEYFKYMCIMVSNENYILYVTQVLYLYPCITATNGVVLATEKKQKSILYDESSIHKIEMITKNVGMIYSGMGPDYRYHSL